MSPAGWPKGKPRGPLSERTKALMAAGRARSLHNKKKRDFSLATNPSSITPSPAVWLSPHIPIGDCQYVNGELDEVMLRALRDRVVYADHLCCHHEPPFQDVTIEVIAATERCARKNGFPRRHGLGVVKLPPVAAPKPKLVVIKGSMSEEEWRAARVAERERKLVAEVATRARKGAPLLEVVAEMFPVSREGRPLLEVVSALFDS